MKRFRFVMMMALMLPLLMVGQNEAFCDNCEDLRSEVGWAMTKTGNDILLAYQSNDIPEGVTVDMVSIDLENENLEAAYFIQHQSEDGGGIVMLQFSDRNELYGSPYSSGDLDQVPLAVWLNFKNSDNQMEFYRNIFFNSPLFSYHRSMLAQYGCPLLE